MTQRGEPGEEGKPGMAGEEGLPTGEGGRGGEGGEGGRGGQGATQGPGGGGGEGGAGGRGARGEQGPPGERGDIGPQPKLRWAPAVGYLLLALVLGFLIWRVQTTCVDTRGDRAIRHQWERVAVLIEAQSGGKITPQAVPIIRDANGQFTQVKAGDKLTAEMVRTAFAASYRQALDEAGPPPDCRGLSP